MENLVLSEIEVKKSVRVLKIRPQSNVRRRLMDMGIVPGTQIRIEGKAPMGDPIEVKLRGYKLTLRKNEAKDILVQQI